MSVEFQSKHNLFVLRAGQSTYAIKILEDGEICHLHWGGALPDHLLEQAEALGKPRPFCPEHRKGVSFDMLPQEYPAPDCGDFREAAYELNFPTGHIMSSLTYRSHKIIGGKPSLEGLPSTYVNSSDEAQTLKIYACDELFHVDVILSYSVFDDFNVITRSVEFINRGNETLNLGKALSCSVDFDHSAFRLLHLPGSWISERNVMIEPLSRGIKSIQSKRGASSHQHNPFVALLSADADETSGEVFALNFVYSGNFTAQLEVDQFDRLRVQMGINPYAFEWKLAPGSSFQTPETVMVYSADGLGGMTRTFHRFYRNHLCRGNFKHRERPVLINSWEAMYFDYKSSDIVNLARRAAKLGIELVVLDDGWFGRRDNAKSSLGDWTVDRKKIPEGIEELARQVKKEGVDFGIWFEPEMISPDSDLYRIHPDWCIHVPERPRNLARHQLVLDLSRPEVQEYIINAVSSVLECGLISYVKWDMNRHICNIGSASAHWPGETSHRYMLGLYAVLEALTSRFPEVLFESCSGGGGRYDPGMLYYMPQVWTSDNTDAVCRIEIQKGTSLVYPPLTMGAHVSAVPNHQTGRSTSLSLRGDVAMMGNLGYELDLGKLAEEESAVVARQIEFYKTIRPLISFGDMYRLLALEEKDVIAVQYLSEDRRQGLLFYCDPAAVSRTLRFQGLEKTARYSVDTVEKTGAELMQEGITVAFEDGMQSRILRIERKQ